MADEWCCTVHNIDKTIILVLTFVDGIEFIELSSYIQKKKVDKTIYICIISFSVLHEYGVPIGYLSA